MKTPALTPFERQVVKRLLSDGQSYQDVQQLINTGRRPTINPGRFAGWQGWEIQPASDTEIARYRYEKSLVDLRSGLSPIDDERLFRAREAMMSAVQIFNSPTTLFKVEIFPVLSQIAWTYLMHEYYQRKGVEIVDGNGNSLLISQILNREDCPLAEDVKKNLIAIKVLRDNVEHKTLSSVGRAVVAKVREASGADFTSHHHQLAWKKYGARPRSKAKDPSDCKKDYCHYHKAHKDYTYSDKWIEFLISVVQNADEFESLKSFKPKD